MKGGNGVLTVILNDPRLWLYLAVLVVFAVSSMVVLLSALAVLIVAAGGAGVFAVYRRLRGFSPVYADHPLGGGNFSVEDRDRSEVHHPAPALQPAGAPNLVPRTRDGRPHWVSAPNEAGIVEGASGIQPGGALQISLKPLNRRRKRRKK